jgi:hypothetical protein
MTFEARDSAYFNVRVSTVRWKSQRLGRAFILEDITERRRGEISAFAGDENLFSPDQIPVICVLRSQDEKIIEVNRSFVLELGYERKDVVGQSLFHLGILDAYQRGELLGMLRSEGLVKNHPLTLVSINREKKAFSVSAHRTDILEDSYFVLLANPVS